MENSGRFSDYLFAKMVPSTVNENGNGANDCSRKTTERCETPVELTGMKKWISDNVMLLVTLSGVILGIGLGRFLVFFK